tara:strand:+ start:2748 stop:3272 length:525 start_codon:yes stop_codon:yes gene_type:complete
MCDITNGIDKRCNSGQGGNAELYLFNFEPDQFTIVDGEATAVNANLTEVWSFYIKGDGNTLSAPLLVDAKLGSSVCTQTLVAQFNGTSAPKSNQLTMAAQGHAGAVLKDRDGNYHLLGHEVGFNVSTTIEEVTGGARGDFYGYNGTFIGETKILPPKLDAATATAFLALVVANS